MDDSDNIRKWLEEAEELYGERVEAIVVGKHYDRSYGDDKLPDENVILSREDGLTKLDVDYDAGLGGADCFPMYAWTASRVFFIMEYDGATGLHYLPRNPIECEPDWSGNDPTYDVVAKQPSLIRRSGDEATRTRSS